MIKTGFDAIDRSSEGLGARSVSEPAPPFARLTLRAQGRPGSGTLFQSLDISTSTIHKSGVV